MKIYSIKEILDASNNILERKNKKNYSTNEDKKPSVGWNLWSLLS